jgi:hypothetical protein
MSSTTTCMMHSPICSLMDFTSATPFNLKVVQLTRTNLLRLPKRVVRPRDPSLGITFSTRMATKLRPAPIRKAYPTKPKRTRRPQRRTFIKPEVSPPSTTKTAYVQFLSKMLALLSSIVLGVLTVWLAWVAWLDGHCSSKLARWTSQKDFLEYCSQVKAIPNLGFVFLRGGRMGMRSRAVARKLCDTRYRHPLNALTVVATPP